MEQEETAVATVNAEVLIAKAIDKGISVDTMERLLAMRRELKAEAAREAYFVALSKFQAACPPIVKTKQVMHQGKVRYSYAPLDAIIAQVKDALRDSGLSYTLDTAQTPEDVTAICAVHHVAGHTETTRFTVPVDRSASMNDSQKVGSALTYAKRYAFCNGTGIMTADADDDANSNEAEFSKDGAAMLAKLYVMTADALRSGELTTKQFAATALALDDFLAKHSGTTVADYTKVVESKLKKKHEGEAGRRGPATEPAQLDDDGGNPQAPGDPEEDMAEFDTKGKEAMEKRIRGIPGATFPEHDPIIRPDEGLF